MTRRSVTLHHPWSWLLMLWWLFATVYTLEGLLR
jgi:hypothetical protein